LTPAKTSRNNRNMSVSDAVSPTYKRDFSKLEGFIKPDLSPFSTLKLIDHHDFSRTP
jgi:hypothetical protein